MVLLPFPSHCIHLFKTSEILTVLNGNVTEKAELKPNGTGVEGQKCHDHLLLNLREEKYPYSLVMIVLCADLIVF